MMNNFGMNGWENNMLAAAAGQPMPPSSAAQMPTSASIGLQGRGPSMSMNPQPNFQSMNSMYNPVTQMQQPFGGGTNQMLQQQQQQQWMQPGMLQQQQQQNMQIQGGINSQGMGMMSFSTPAQQQHQYMGMNMMGSGYPSQSLQEFYPTNYNPMVIPGNGGGYPPPSMGISSSSIVSPNLASFNSTNVVSNSNPQQQMSFYPMVSSSIEMNVPTSSSSDIMTSDDLLNSALDAFEAFDKDTISSMASVSMGSSNNTTSNSTSSMFGHQGGVSMSSSSSTLPATSPQTQSKQLFSTTPSTGIIQCPAPAASRYTSPVVNKPTSAIPFDQFAESLLDSTFSSPASSVETSPVKVKKPTPERAKSLSNDMRLESELKTEVVAVISEDRGDEAPISKERQELWPSLAFMPDEDLNEAFDSLKSFSKSLKVLREKLSEESIQESLTTIPIFVKKRPTSGPGSGQENSKGHHSLVGNSTCVDCRDTRKTIHAKSRCHGCYVKNSKLKHDGESTRMRSRYVPKVADDWTCEICKRSDVIPASKRHCKTCYRRYLRERNKGRTS